jgi:hypothetical protein
MTTTIEQWRARAERAEAEREAMGEALRVAQVGEAEAMAVVMSQEGAIKRITDERDALGWQVDALRRRLALATACVEALRTLLRTLPYEAPFAVDAVQAFDDVPGDAGNNGVDG